MGNTSRDLDAEPEAPPIAQVNPFHLHRKTAGVHRSALQRREDYSSDE